MPEHDSAGQRSKRRPCRRRPGSFTAAGALLLVLFVAAEVPAQSTEMDGEQAFVEGSRHFAEGDYGMALARFRSALEAGKHSAAVLYNIGVCEYRVGEYVAAEQTFLRISRDFPDMRLLADYNRGLALVRQQRNEEAEQLFRNAAASQDPVLARLAGSMLERLVPNREVPGEVTGNPNWFVYLDVGAGYDDNVALLDDSGATAGATTDSTFSEVFGQFGGSLGQTGAFQYDASTYLVRYFDAGQFDQNAFRLAGSWLWRIGEWVGEAGPYFAYSTLDGNGYDRRGGLQLGLSGALGNSTRLRVLLAHEEIRDADARYEFVSGARQRASLRWTRRITDTQRWHLEYAYTNDDRAGASVSPARHRFATGYGHRFNTRWSVSTDLVYRSSHYDDLAAPREENMLEFGLMVMCDIGPEWQLTAEARLSDNDANADGFSYTRNRMQLSINRLF